MGEKQPNPEVHRDSVLSGEWGDLTNPGAYLEAAKRGVAALRKLLNSAEK